MIVEVSIRMLALGRAFWQSPGNFVDLFVVMLCFLTLLLVGDKCSPVLDYELSLDALVLVARNVLQAVRLFLAIDRYPYLQLFRGLMVLAV